LQDEEVAQESFDLHHTRNTEIYMFPCKIHFQESKARERKRGAEKKRPFTYYSFRTIGLTFNQDSRLNLAFNMILSPFCLFFRSDFIHPTGKLGQVNIVKTKNYVSYRVKSKYANKMNKNKKNCFRSIYS
jgi:hypothetical protein